MSKAVRAAMLKASVANVKACLSLDEGEGVVWTLTPVADVHNVLDELERLQTVEERIRASIREKEQARDTLLKDARACRDEWQIEDALYNEDKARRTLEEIMGLEDLIHG